MAVPNVSGRVFPAVHQVQEGEPEVAQLPGEQGSTVALYMSGHAFPRGHTVQEEELPIE